MGTDITKLKHIHFTGIKGVGMTSLALCAKDLGIQISGSDVEEVFVTDETLKRNKIKWSVGFSQKNLKPRPSLVVTTGAHGGLRNPEVLAAKRKKIPVMTHAEALGEFTKGKDTLAVCGVGGKTTTSSMIATMLHSAKRYPSYAIGVADIFPLGTPGRFDKKGCEFVAEADEYAISPGVNNNPRFSLLEPKIIVVTNIEHDHPDIYPAIADTKRAFGEFFQKIPHAGLLIANIDNKNIRDVIRGLSVPMKTYGMRVGADYQIVDVEYFDQKTSFSVKAKDGILRFALRVPGRFNVFNATASFIAGKHVGLPNDAIQRGLYAYKGCKRRFEKVGEAGGVSVYDDYAHHPLEIKSTLRAARQWFPKRRIIVVFQPHSYSRTKALFSEFVQSFDNADKIVLMDIYASARESDRLGVSSEQLAEAMYKYEKDVYYMGSHKETLEFLAKEAKRGDVIITMGAGDIFHIHKVLLRHLTR